MPSERCPRCSSPASEVWTAGRKLAFACVERLRCGWIGEPFTPQKQEIVTRRESAVDVSWNRWIVEGYDQYGHVYMVSNTHSLNGADVLNEARESIERYSAYEGYGECVAVVYAPGELEGVLVTREGPNDLAEELRRTGEALPIRRKPTA